MAVTTSWEINTMERDVSDGYVTKIIYRITGLSDSVEKARRTGEVNFIKPESLPSGFIDFASLESATVMSWVKASIGSTRVGELETQLKAEVNEILTPTTAMGVPDGWS